MRTQRTRRDEIEKLLLLVLNIVLVILTHGLWLFVWAFRNKTVGKIAEWLFDLALVYFTNGLWLIVVAFKLSKAIANVIAPKVQRRIGSRRSGGA